MRRPPWSGQKGKISRSGYAGRAPDEVVCHRADGENRDDGGRADPGGPVGLHGRDEDGEDPVDPRRSGGDRREAPLQDGPRGAPHPELPIHEGRAGRDRDAARGLTCRCPTWRSSPSTAAARRLAGKKTPSRAATQGSGSTWGPPSTWARRTSSNSSCPGTASAPG